MEIEGDIVTKNSPKKGMLKTCRLPSQKMMSHILPNS